MRIKQIIKQAKPKLQKMFGNNTSTNNTNTSNQNTTKEIENNTSAGLNETNITKNLTGDNTPEYKEEEISSFTTKIVTKDSSRQKNISITCSTLNDTLVENGAEFSFCNTVGRATTAKGYEEADIFDSNRKKEKRSWWW